MTEEERIADVLSRYSVADLIEQSDADAERGDELFYQSSGDIEIVETGETNLVRWWRIRSGKTVYEARRFKNFVWCSCRAFQFSRRMCKHLALTTGVRCERCRLVSAKVGKLCYDCDGVVGRFTKGKIIT